MPDGPDLDEPFSLYPLEGEDVLKELLGVEDEETDPDDPEDDET